MNPFEFGPEQIELLRSLILVSSVVFLLLPFILFVATAVKKTVQGKGIGTLTSLFCAVVSLALFVMVWGVWTFAGPWSESVVYTYIVALLANGGVMLMVPKLRRSGERPSGPKPGQIERRLKVVQGGKS